MHVNIVSPVLFVIPAVGMSCVTVIVAADVQPFDSVTVTVYVPGAVILAVANDPKLPLQE